MSGAHQPVAPAAPQGLLSSSPVASSESSSSDGQSTLSPSLSMRHKVDISTSSPAMSPATSSISSPRYNNERTSFGSASDTASQHPLTLIDSFEPTPGVDPSKKGVVIDASASPAPPTSAAPARPSAAALTEEPPSVQGGFTSATTSVDEQLKRTHRTSLLRSHSLFRSLTMSPAHTQHVRTHSTSYIPGAPPAPSASSPRPAPAPAPASPSSPSSLNGRQTLTRSASVLGQNLRARLPRRRSFPSGVVAVANQYEVSVSAPQPPTKPEVTGINVVPRRSVRRAHRSLSSLASLLSMTVPINEGTPIQTPPSEPQRPQGSPSRFTLSSPLTAANLGTSSRRPSVGVSRAGSSISSEDEPSTPHSPPWASTSSRNGSNKKRGSTTPILTRSRRSSLVHNFQGMFGHPRRSYSTTAEEGGGPNALGLELNLSSTSSGTFQRTLLASPLEKPFTLPDGSSNWSSHHSPHTFEIQDDLEFLHAVQKVQQRTTQPLDTTSRTTSRTSLDPIPQGRISPVCHLTPRARRALLPPSHAYVPPAWYDLAFEPSAPPWLPPSPSIKEAEPMTKTASAHRILAPVVARRRTSMEVGAQPIRRSHSCGGRLERETCTWLVTGDTSKAGSKSDAIEDLRSPLEKPTLVETVPANPSPLELVPSLQAKVWAKEVKALFVIRELFQTEQTYAQHLTNLLAALSVSPVRGKRSSHVTHLQTHLPAFIALSQRLVSQWWDAPTASGIAQSFVELATHLQSAFVGWSRCVAQVMQSLRAAELGSSSRSRWPSVRPARDVLPALPLAPPPSPAGSVYEGKAAGRAAKALSALDIVIMPTQRVPRYLLLLRQLSRLTPEHTDAQTHLSTALDVCTRVADLCDGVTATAPPTHRRQKSLPGVTLRF